MTEFMPISDFIVDGIDLTPFVAAAAPTYAAHGDQICVSLLFSLVNSDTDSLPDPYKVCIAMVLEAASIYTIIKAIYEAGGLNALELMLAELVGNGAEGSDADLSSVADEALADPGHIAWSSGKPPKDNCLNPEEADELEDTLPLQTHHILTVKHKTKWTGLFRKVTDELGLSLDGEWNKIPVPHRGSHPHQYHSWIHENVLLAERLASGDAQKFIDLLGDWITSVIRENPTILRLAYWKCRR